MNTGNMAQTTILPNPDQIQEVRTYLRGIWNTPYFSEAWFDLLRDTRP
ncbi:MAG: hypothetical protein LAP39_25390 [Acidobacteriia bacterium]|nr:hypothetical protein [Terriglobia bacterium]